MFVNSVMVEGTEDVFTLIRHYLHNHSQLYYYSKLSNLNILYIVNINKNRS